MGLLDGLTPNDWTNLAIGLLGNTGPTTAGLSKGLLAVQGGRQAQGVDELRRLQAEAAQLDLQARRQQMARDEQIAALAPKFFNQQGPMPDGSAIAPDLPGYASAVAGIDAQKGVPLMLQAAQLGVKESPYGKIDPKDYTPESLQVFTRTKNPADLVAYRAPEKAKLHYQDLGGHIGVFNDQGVQVAKLPKTESPGAGSDKPPSGYRKTPDGNLAFIPGGPADPSVGQKPATPTEDERRSAGLAIRLNSALKAMREMPGGMSPEIGPEFVRSVSGGKLEAAANVMTSAKRQQVEAAQLDALDAALTLATGAAYTKEQLKNLSKSYFPQIGDDEATKQAKSVKLEEIIQTARIRAGRAADSIDQVGAKPGPKAGPKVGAVEDGYVFVGGNPADPKSWVKK